MTGPGHMGVGRLYDENDLPPDEEYGEFLRGWLAREPEPPLDLTEPDRFTHRKKNGDVVCAGMHYPDSQVYAHIAWVTRLQVAWEEWKKRDTNPPNPII